MISEKLSTDSRRMLQNGVPQFVGFCRCTPCRQRRGKGRSVRTNRGVRYDAPRAGSAEAKSHKKSPFTAQKRCTPCRQRRGKASRSDFLRRVQDAPRAGSAEAKFFVKGGGLHAARMHPVQAAPRQSYERGRLLRPPAMHPVQAAPRQRSRVMVLLPPPFGMHPVQAAPRQRRGRTAHL